MRNASIYSPKGAREEESQEFQRWLWLDPTFGLPTFLVLFGFTQCLNYK